MNIRFFRWYGSKYRVIDSILACIPSYITCWYEACMGSAAVTLNSPRHQVELLTDMDEELVYLFSIMADRTDGANLLDRLLETQYSESEFVRAQRAFQNGYQGIEPIRKAEMIFIRITQSFNSVRQSFRRRGMSQRDYSDLNIRNLPLVYERLQGVHVRRMDCVDVVERVRDNPTAYIYLDVPYLWELRAEGARNIYGYEMSRSQHIRLLETCKTAKSCIMLCGYKNTTGQDLYDTVLGVGQPDSPWRSYTLAELAKTCQTKEKRDVAIETIWVNYPLPPAAQFYINTNPKQEIPANSPLKIQEPSGIITAQ